MGKYFDALNEDVRFIEGLKSCMNCGICTAICPAASFYNYDPRVVVNIVQSRDEEKIEELLKSETIWYCGQCLSCKTRCPRGNTPGYIIMALRTLSQKTGLFIYSEKGRQQLAIKRITGESILNIGYCVYPDLVKPEWHPEQGPAWEWVYKHREKIMSKFGANYKGKGPGALRKIDDKDLDELKEIFKVTGNLELFETIEEHSYVKAREMNLAIDETLDNEYIYHISNYNGNNHSKE
ncbi:MAG: 4Fe-4S dicluster domain-containing protein [Bacteroidales bacterium]|nr:4Fe-4S dicluster domain-containing protein [Bacteroidales bacterium]